MFLKQIKQCFCRRWQIVSQHVISLIEEEEPGSVAEVSYYSYEYDPDTDSFSPESEEKLIPIGGEEEEAADTKQLSGHILTVDTKDSPERWWDTTYLPQSLKGPFFQKCLAHVKHFLCHLHI